MSTNEATLKALHEAVASELLEIIQNGVPTSWDEQGAVLARRKPSAAEFSAAIAFLKANDITASLDDTAATRTLREALEQRRKLKKPVMADFLSDVHLQ